MANLLNQKLTHEQAQARIARLQDLNVRELRKEWVMLFGSHPYTTNNKIFLIKRLTWRINTLVNGGITERALKRAHEIADESLIRLRAARHKVVTAAEKPLASDIPVEQMPIGTVITREYKGKVHAVTVLGNGRFAYEGQVFDNLTSVAWHICGYHKSGNTFFNLPVKPRTRKVS